MNVNNHGKIYTVFFKKFYYLSEDGKVVMVKSKRRPHNINRFYTYYMYEPKKKRFIKSGTASVNELCECIFLGFTSTGEE